jgi:acyl-CoA thioester hydrolase
LNVSELDIRVRYAETDQMRVAHHSSYLVWFEAGRTEFIRACGRSYAQLEEDGWLLVVIEAYCRYRRPARYDEVLRLRTTLRELGPARVSFNYELSRADDGAAVADGYTVHAVVDRGGRVRRMPESLRQLFERAGALNGPENQ